MSQASCPTTVTRVREARRPPRTATRAVPRPPPYPRHPAPRTGAAFKVVSERLGHSTPGFLSTTPDASPAARLSPSTRCRYRQKTRKPKFSGLPVGGGGRTRTRNARVMSAHQEVSLITKRFDADEQPCRVCWWEPVGARRADPTRSGSAARCRDHDRRSDRRIAFRRDLSHGRCGRRALRSLSSSIGCERG